MATIKGRAVMWSVGAQTYTAGIVTTVNQHFAQSLTLDRKSDKRRIKDTGNVCRTVVYSDFQKELSLSVIPVALAAANTLLAANASAMAQTLVPGTTVTVADSYDTGTVITANWNVDESSQKRTVDGEAVVDLKLSQSDEGVELTTAMTP